MVLHPRDFIAEKQWMWGVLGRIPLDFMICTVRFGNGAVISGTVTMTVHRLTEVLGKLEQIITECCVEVRGTTMRSIAVLLTATSTLRSTRTGTGVFVSR